MKHQELLSIIRDRLNELGPQEVLNQLYECRTLGPTIEEFLENSTDYTDFFDEAYSVPFTQDSKCNVILVAANDESAFDAWENCSLYDLAA